jgi:hypothetical protein
MAFANVSDIIATTIESRTKSIADNVTKNNALLSRLEQRGKIKTVSGGSKIFQELSFAENGNAGWYSGYDLLPVAAQDVISAAEFEFKQAACPVTISGLDMLKNSGKEQFIDLMEGRVGVAESTMANLISGGIYSDGTGAGGKQLTGLNAAVPVVPAGTTYGGIVTNTFPFWTNAVQDQTAAQMTAALVQSYFNALWAKLVRGMDRPDLIMVDSALWAIYLASLQTAQRFTDPSSAALGFPSIKYMDADVVLDGGIGGFCPASTGFFLNTKYIHYRPHASRNFVPLSPGKRYAINQDAEVQILAWAGNLTCSGRQFQGRIDFNG